MFKSSYALMTKLALAVTTVLMLGSCAESPTGRPQLMLFDQTQVNKMGIQTFEDLKESIQVSSRYQLLPND